MTKIVGVSGSLSHLSRTLALVEVILGKVSNSSHSKVNLINVADIKDLGNTRSYEQLPKEVAEAHEILADADLIVIGTPVYKGSYTGLLKHFFDLLDPAKLEGKIAILVATGGSDQHALVLEHQLRPLMTFFGVVTVPTAVYARDNDFIDYQLINKPILSRIDQAVNQAYGLLRLPQAANILLD